MIAKGFISESAPIAPKTAPIARMSKKYRFTCLGDIFFIISPPPIYICR